MLIAAVALAACGNESFNEVEAVRAPLIGGLTSYARPSEVLPDLASFSPPAVVENSALSTAYRHIGHSGKLRLLFFNDRLQQTLFYPDNPDAYVNALRASGIPVADGHEWKNENTVIWAALDHQARRYVAWADQRLVDRSKRWISRYS